MKNGQTTVGIFLLFVLIFFSLIRISGQTIAVIDSINAMDYNQMISNLEETKEIFIKNIEAANSIGYEKGAAVGNERLAIVNFYLKKTDIGLENSLLALSYYEKQNDYIGLATCYADIGFSIKSVYLDKGMEYFRNAIAISKQHDIGLAASKVYNNYGTLLRQSGDLDSALFYHQKSLDVCLEFNDSIGIPYSLNNLVTVYSAKGMYKEAFEFLDKSDAYRKLEHNNLSWADNVAYRADIYFDMKSYDSAKVYYLEALELSKKSKFLNLITFCLERLSNIYELQNDAAQALYYFKELQNHKDSVLTLETNKAVAALQEEFDSVNKEKKIAEQSLEIEQQNKRWLYGIFGFTFLMLSGLFLFLNQRRKRKLEQERLKHAKELEKANLEKAFYEEKLRIGRELHDNIGSQLTFMISSVDNLVYTEKEDPKKNKLSKISDFGRSTMKELRSTIWAMKNDGGTLEDLILKINEQKMLLAATIDVTILDQTSTPVHLNALQMLNIFRIVQESLQNVIKYANASAVKVIFVQEKGDFLVKIVDDGQGFDTSRSTEGNGLSNMQRRCEDSSGTFKIKSSPIGTEICCTLTLKD